MGILRSTFSHLTGEQSPSEAASHAEREHRLRNTPSTYGGLRMRLLVEEFKTKIREGKCDDQLNAILEAIKDREFDILNGRAV